MRFIHSNSFVLIIPAEEYKLRRSPLCNFLKPHVTVRLTSQQPILHPSISFSHTLKRILDGQDYYLTFSPLINAVQSVSPYTIMQYFILSVGQDE